MTDNAPFALLQTVNPAVSTGTIAATLASTQLRSLILVFVGMSGRTDTSTPAPTDNGGNTYTLAYRANAPSGGCTELWYARNTSPATTVTVTFSGATDTKSVFVREFAGMSQAGSALDVTGTAAGTASGTNTIAVNWSGTTSYLTLNVASSSLIGAAAVTIGSFYIGFATQTNGSFSHSIEYNTTVAGTSAGAGLMTAASGTWDMGIASFQLRITGGTPNVSLQRPHPFQPGVTR